MMAQMTFRWFGQARSQAQKRRFARTGRADNCDKLARLYPTHEVFVSQYNACVDRLLAAGYLLEPEAEEARAAVAASNIGAS